jgi:hypothetical protein
MSGGGGGGGPPAGRCGAWHEAVLLCAVAISTTVSTATMLTETAIRIFIINYSFLVWLRVVGFSATPFVSLAFPDY